VAAPGRLRAETLAGQLRGARLYLWLGAAALVIGALSLLIPSTPSYDPWAWLVWGREIVHVKLHTTGGPSWKPLPVIFTTLFAPFGKAAPDLWLVVARAGAVMAAAMVFRLSWRLTREIGARLVDAGSGGRSVLIGAGLVAGAIAAVCLVLSSGYISDNALGYSEGLMTAIVLIAFDLHLDGKHRAAFAVGFFAALDRPEIWLFWGPYGLWLFWKDPGARRLVIGLFALIPILWFLPEYWGSGHFLRGVNRAQHPRSNSPAFAKCPFCSELADHAWRTVLVRMKLAAALAVGAAAIVLFRGWRAGARRFETQRERALAAVVAAGALGLGWWVVIAIMTQAGFSGNNRYLVLGAALIEIAGGVGWGWAGLALGARVRALVRSRRSGYGASTGPSGSAIGWSGVVALALVFAFIPSWVGNRLVNVQLTHRALVYQAHLRSGITAAVEKAGGAHKVLACGAVMTEGFQVPMLAWTLGVHTIDVEASPQSVSDPGPPPNVIFQTRAQRNAHLLPVVGAWKTTPYRLVARTRTFRVFEQNCRSTVTG
jgi:hypothetical protein